MASQKGSLKDRIRSWNIFLRHKLSIRKKEKAKKKQVQISASGKYYSKPRVFGLTIAGLFLGIFESKADKDNKIEKLELEINSFNPLNKKQKIEVLEKRLVVMKSQNRFNDSAMKRLSYCEKKLSFIKDIQARGEEKIDYDNIDTKLYTPILEVKIMNKELKQHAKRLKEINDQLKNATKYNDLYELEFELKQLKIKINDLLTKYHNVKDLPGFDNLQNILDISEIDFWNLRFSPSEINSQINTCNECLKKIDDKRKELLKNRAKSKPSQNKDNKENKQEKKQKEDKKQKSKNDNKLLEIKLAQKLVLDRIILEKKSIEKLRKSICKMTVKKRRKTIFSYASSILSSIINFGFSLFPISLFQNKLMGGLVSGIMINNSLKSIRKILTPEVDAAYILFEDFAKELNKTENYLNSVSYICADSLSQINEIRSSIHNQYGSDIEYSDVLSKYLRDLDNVEAKILSEQEMIINLQEQVADTKISHKQKVKVWYD